MTLQTDGPTTTRRNTDDSWGWSLQQTKSWCFERGKNKNLLKPIISK